jgi:arylsulfatase A-like enzyme
MELSRQEILKLSSILPLSRLLPQWIAIPGEPNPNPDAANIIVILFDALSALHLPLYGYSRDTAPNLSRLAESSTVFHNHFSGGNFTTPGTASLLTGNYPFIHRAFKLNRKTIPEFDTRNIFSEFSDYTRVAYTHNFYAGSLLNQFKEAININKPREELVLNNLAVVSKLFPNDNDIAQLSWVRINKREINRYSGSLFLSKFDARLKERIIAPYEKQFPRGVPETPSGEYYVLKQAIDWIAEQLAQLPQPFLGYFHLMPPHFPYNTSREFISVFAKDGFKPPTKPRNVFSKKYKQPKLNLMRQQYDEFILYCDQAFSELYKMLEAKGLLENTWLVFTSDHGEMFERGIHSHVTQTLYNPIVHIPLVIQSPGQQTRTDVYFPTSAIDVLPTLLHVTGKTIPSWCPGEILPPYRSEPVDPERSLFALEAKFNDAYKPITKASIMNIKWPYKIVEYRGYDEMKNTPLKYDMFDLEEDPEELNDIFSPDDPLARQMIEEIDQQITEADKPYNA